MNVRLLRKVAKHIAEEPRRLDMDVLTDIRDPKEDDRNPPCGTVGCIAGWSCLLTGMPRKKSWSPTRYWEHGQKLLGLTKEEGKRLFNTPSDAVFEHERYGEDITMYWPLRFAKRYENAKTPRGRASATVARIEHFIKTKGKE
jgi:hypothetical protein